MSRSTLRHKTTSQKAASPRLAQHVPANDGALAPLVVRQTRAWLAERQPAHLLVLAFLLFAVGLSVGLSVVVLMEMEGQRAQLASQSSAPATVMTAAQKPVFDIKITDPDAAPVVKGATGIELPADDALQQALLETSSRAVGDNVGGNVGNRLIAKESAAEIVAPPAADDNDIKNLRRVVRLNPRNASAQLALAQAFQAAGDPDGAEETLLNALDHDSKNPRYHLALARFYDHAGRGRDALAEYRWLLNAPEAGRANFPLDDIANRAEFLAAKMGGRVFQP